MGIRGLIVLGVIAGCAHAPAPPPAPAAAAPPVEADAECDAQSDADRCFQLGVQHQLANRLATDDPVARRSFALACDRGAGRGCLYLAQELLITNDLTNAIQRATRGCELANREACGFAGEIAHRAFLVTKDASWRTTACGFGSVEACVGMLRAGEALPATKTNLVALYTIACKNHVAAACTALPGLIEAERDLLLRLVAAIGKQDAAVFGELAAEPLDVGPVGDDNACTAVGRQPAVDVHAAQLACLAPLGLHVEAASEPRAAPVVLDRRGEEWAVDVVDHRVASITRKHPFGPRPVAAPGGGPGSVPPQALEVYRIAGDKLIVPTDADKTMIHNSGQSRFLGSFKLCLDTRGEVANVAMLKSTGIFGYDRRIERTLYSWRYRPFLVDGQPTAVCTAVTFIYSQR